MLFIRQRRSGGRVSLIWWHEENEMLPTKKESIYSTSFYVRHRLIFFYLPISSWLLLTGSWGAPVTDPPTEE